MGIPSAILEHLLWMAFALIPCGTALEQQWHYWHSCQIGGGQVKGERQGGGQVKGERQGGGQVKGGGGGGRGLQERD